MTSYKQLKAIQKPDMSEFTDLIKKTRNLAKKAGIKKQSLAEAIDEVRKKKWT